MINIFPAVYRQRRAVYVQVIEFFQPVGFLVNFHSLITAPKMERKIDSSEKPINRKSNNKDSDKERFQPGKKKKRSKCAPGQQPRQYLQKPENNPVFRVF